MMRSLFTGLLLAAFSFSLNAGEVLIENWDEGIVGWSAKLAGDDADRTDLLKAVDGAVELTIPKVLVLLKKSDVEVPANATAVAFDIHPLTADWGWLEVGIIYQSSANGWDTLGLKQLEKKAEVQTVSFPIDAAKHANPSWSTINIRINAEEEIRVKVDNLRFIVE